MASALRSTADFGFTGTFVSEDAVLSGSLQIRPDRVIMWASGSQLASWDISECRVERVTASRFSVQAHGETLTFTADDPAGLEEAIGGLRKNGQDPSSKIDIAALITEAPIPSRLRVEIPEPIPPNPPAPKLSGGKRIDYKRSLDPTPKALTEANTAGLTSETKAVSETPAPIETAPDVEIGRLIEPEAFVETPSVVDRVRLVEPGSFLETLSVVDRVQLNEPEASVESTSVPVRPRLIEPEAFVETPAVSEPERQAEPEEWVETPSIIETAPVLAPEPLVAPEPLAEPHAVVALPTVDESQTGITSEWVADIPTVVEAALDPEPLVDLPTVVEAALDPEPLVDIPIVAEDALKPEPVVEIANVIAAEATMEPEPAVEIPTVVAASVTADSVVGRTVEPGPMAKTAPSIIEPITSQEKVASPTEQSFSAQSQPRTEPRKRRRPIQRVPAEPDPQEKAVNEPTLTIELPAAPASAEPGTKTEDPPESTEPSIGRRPRIKSFQGSPATTASAPAPSTVEPDTTGQPSEPVVEEQPGTVAEEVITRTRRKRIKAARILPSDIKDMAIKVGAVGMAVLLAAGFAYSIYWLMGGSTYEPPPGVDVTTTLPSPTTATTEPPVVTTLPVRTTTLFQTDPTELTRRWNTLAEETREELVLLTGITSPMSISVTPYISLEGLLDPVDGRMTLRAVPTGVPDGDGAILTALGMMIAMADPSLEPDDRRLLLQTLGLDIRDPQLGGVDAGLNYNGLNYRLIYFEGENVLDFTITPVSSSPLSSTTTTAP